MFSPATIDPNTLFAGVGGALAVAVAGAVVNRIKERREEKDRQARDDEKHDRDLEARVDRLEEFMLGKPAVGGWGATKGFIVEWPEFQREIRQALARIEKGVNGNGGH